MNASLVAPFPFTCKGLSSRFLRAMLAAVVCVCLVGAGCAMGDEFINLLTAIEPAADGIVAIVCLVEAPACIAATAADATYKAAATALTAAYHDWQTADASQQPGKLGALQAAVVVLQNDFRNLLGAAHVTNTTRQNAIVAIGSAITGEISQIVALVEQTKQSGGTTAAALMVLHEQYGGGPEPQTTTPTATKAQKKRKRIAAKLSAAHFKSDLRKQLEIKTGDAQLDKVNAETAAKLK